MLAFAARTVVSVAGRPAWRALDGAGGQRVAPATQLSRNGEAGRRGEAAERRLCNPVSSCRGGVDRCANPVWQRRRLRHKVRGRIEPRSCGAKFQRPRKVSGDLASGSTSTLRQEPEWIFSDSHTDRTLSLGHLRPGQSHFSSPSSWSTYLGLSNGPWGIVCGRRKSCGGLKLDCSLLRKSSDQ